MSLARGIGVVAATLVACGGGAASGPTTIDAPLPSSQTVEVPLPGTASTERRRAAPGEGRTRATVDGALGLYVGQPIDAAERLVGGTVSHVTADEERTAWESTGYRTDEEPIFAIGFDAVSTFQKPTLPVYKIYAVRGTVRVIKLSAYVVDAAAVSGRRVGFEPSCFLLAPSESAAETFGSPTMVEEAPDRSRVVFHYVEAGLSVLAEEGRLQVFDIFGSLTQVEEKRMRDALFVKSSRGRS